jgi:hypothetical protein
MKKGNNTLCKLFSTYPNKINAHKTHEVFQPFSTKISLISYKYISNYSFLPNVTPHIYPREFSIPTPNYKIIQCHKNLPNPPLILLLHKATKGPH